MVGTGENTSNKPTMRTLQKQQQPKKKTARRCGRSSKSAQDCDFVPFAAKSYAPKRSREEDNDDRGYYDDWSDTEPKARDNCEWWEELERRAILAEDAAKEAARKAEEARRDAAARVIQNVYLWNYYSPYTPMGRRRLMREFDDLAREFDDFRSETCISASQVWE